MPSRLVALRLPPAQLVPRLRALWDGGDAVLPLPLDAPPAAVADTLAALRPAAVEELGPDGPVRRTLDDPLPVEAGTALVVATSGSTGMPKGVVLGHAALDASTSRSLDRLGARPGDRVGLALPLHHVAGLQVVRRAWTLGTEPVLLDARDPDALASAEVAHLALVPTQVHRLLATGAPLGHLRSLLVGGARVEPALRDGVTARGGRLVVSYGMTETAGGCVYDGRPLADVEVAIAAVAGATDRGRIRLRGPMLLDAVRTAQGHRPARDDDGWFTTGDLGRWVDGRLEVLGRADDVVISGGENVPAGVVAATLRVHPEVEDAAVVGRPDPDRGEVVVAVVVARDPRSAPTLEELRAHVAATHPWAWAPREVRVVASLPRDAMGKVHAARLRELAADG